MKRFFTFATTLLVTLLAGVSSSAQNIGGQTHLSSTELNDNTPSEPLFVVGKEWKVVHGASEMPGMKEYYDPHQLMWIKVTGEKEIDGQLCAELKVTCKSFCDMPHCYHCIYNSFNPEEFLVYAYEKDCKIFVYRNPGPYIEDEVEMPDGMMQAVIKYGEPYFDLYCDYSKLTGTNGWNDGVGSPRVSNEFKHYYTQMIWPTYFWPTYMVTCSLNGDLLYDAREFLDAAGFDYGETAEVTELPKVEDKNNDYYNLQGLKIAHPEKGNHYIHNGKMIIF